MRNGKFFSREPLEGQSGRIMTEYGLLLAMRRGRNLGLGEGKPADIFPTAAKIHGVAPSMYLPQGLPYEIVAG